MMKAISINCDLLSKSSLDICFKKLITNQLRLQSRKKNTRKHTFALKACKTRNYNMPSFTEVEYQHNQSNGTKFKTIR
jgi:hypothetical protein